MHPQTEQEVNFKEFFAGRGELEVGSG